MPGPLETLCLIGVVGDLSDAELLRRFLSARDASSQAAFAALMDRHGPMVLRTARHIVGNTHDADDIFQATFLLLARKACAVRNAESLAGWLHGVTRRIALRSKAAEGLRRDRERRVAKESVAPETGRDSSADWPVLHAEIARLPGRYQEAIVLCYLEGLSTEAAARRLGCAQGTIMSRLSRGRERLHTRLTRRGMGREDLAPASSLSSLVIPITLFNSTAEAASAFASGSKLIAISASARAVTLAKKEILSMGLSTFRTMTAVAMTCAVGLGSASGFVGFGRDAEPPMIAQAAPTAEPKTSGAGEETKPDIDRLQGIWAVKNVTLGGKKLQDRDLTAAKYIFQSNELTVEGDKDSELHAFTLEPSSSPRAMLINRIKPNRVQSGWMLYELKGEKLRLAFKDALKGRPESFDPKPGLIVLELERVAEVAAKKTTQKADSTDAPEIVKTSLNDGEQNVDPATKELRVTFDRDMGEGMSVVGGGPTFPGDPSARARWIDKRTIVIPLKLNPLRSYSLSLNSSRFRNFRSAEGVPVKPYPIDFKTGKKQANN